MPPPSPSFCAFLLRQSPPFVFPTASRPSLSRHMSLRRSTRRRVVPARHLYHTPAACLASPPTPSPSLGSEHDRHHHPPAHEDEDDENDDDDDDDDFIPPSSDEGAHAKALSPKRRRKAASVETFPSAPHPSVNDTDIIQTGSGKGTPTQASSISFSASDVQAIRRGLMRWYRAGHRLFPWRLPPRPSSTSSPSSSPSSSFIPHTPSSSFSSPQYENHQQKTQPQSDPGQPYAIWVSEVMSQQTRIDVVVDYYTRWMTIFPDIPTLAAAPLDRVNQLWAGLGYYRRARFLHAGAQQVMRQFGGVLPGDISSLRSIQGIGPYTAGAIASIAFGVMAPCVDGNVERVLSRVCPEANFCNGRGGSSGSGSAVSGVWWTLASQLVGEEQVKGKKEGKKKGKGKDNRFSMDKANDDNNANDGKPENNNTQTSDDDVQLFWPGDLNQALMELGATVCKPRAAAECHKCPLFAENVCGAARQAAEAGLAPEQYGPFMARYPARLANRAAGGRKKQRKETVKRKRGNVDNDDDEYESDGGGTSGVGGGRVRVSSKGVKIRDEKVAVIVAWTRDICDGNIHNENDDGDDGDNHIDNDNDNDRTRVLIMQRPADGLLGGLWESANVVLDNSKTTNIKTNNHANTHALPASGATHADADPDASAQVADRDSVLWAKVLSGCGHDARVAHDDLVYAGKVTHIFSHIRQQLFVYAVRVDGVSSFSSASSGMTGDGRPFRWVSSKQLNEAAIATQMKKVLGRGLRHVGCCDTVQWIGGVEPRKKKGGKR